jgi:hypothetical protein
MNELTALLQRGESSIRLRQGVVSSVSGGIAKVAVGSAEINARYLKPAPSAGDTVLLTYLSNNPVVLGAFAAKTTTLVDGEGEQDA